MHNRMDCVCLSLQRVASSANIEREEQTIYIFAGFMEKILKILCSIKI